jgi:hypothetical protein
VRPAGIRPGKRNAVAEPGRACDGRPRKSKGCVERYCDNTTKQASCHIVSTAKREPGLEVVEIERRMAEDDDKTTILPFGSVTVACLENFSTRWCRTRRCYTTKVNSALNNFDTKVFFDVLLFLVAGYVLRRGPQKKEKSRRSSRIHFFFFLSFVHGQCLPFLGAFCDTMGCGVFTESTEVPLPFFPVLAACFGSDV